MRNLDDNPISSLSGPIQLRRI